MTILDQQQDTTKIGNALTYLMNAVFVLMTTNYTLNPNFYFLGSTSSSYDFMAYFPIV